MTGLEPMRVLLTGASSGIGRATAFALAEEGHTLTLTARRSAELESLARELRAAGRAVSQESGDVRDEQSVRRVVEAAGRAMGGIDALVHCAGSARFAPLLETSRETWDDMIATNLTGLYHLLREILPVFTARGSGHVIAILSIASRTAFGGSSAYTAAKHGALGLLDSVRQEVRGQGVQVTAILPGATDTPLWDQIDGTWDRSRMMPPGKVARIVASVLRDSLGGSIEEIRVLPTGGNL